MPALVISNISNRINTVIKKILAKLLFKAINTLQNHKLVLKICCYTVIAMKVLNFVTLILLSYC